MRTVGNSGINRYRNKRGFIKITAIAFLAAILLTGTAAFSRTQVRADGAEENREADIEKPQDMQSDEENVSPEYIYCVGSVSKVYVTAAVMHLADEGKVDLDAPVTTYIPEFTMADERYKDITVRMLTDHTSGIMGTTMQGTFLYNDNDTLHHDTLLKQLSAQRLKADPGKYASYCNDGFDLLELIVENVTHMPYTDYVEKLVAPLSCKDTGTAIDMIRKENLVPGYSPEGVLYENTMTMCGGAGGIYASAADVADFGSAFFAGNPTVLSEEAKKEMAQKWKADADTYLDQNGSGWDVVSLPKYEEKNVSVQYKGGDTGMSHAILLTAPEEEISVAVLTNGGTSTYNGMVAQALLDVVLQEEGIDVSEKPDPEVQTVSKIPGSYDGYEGVYAVQNDLGEGATICRVTFPDHKYMHVENHGATRTTATDYLLTQDGEFVKLAFEIENGDLSTARIATGPVFVSFVEKEGTAFLAQRGRQPLPGLGDLERNTYVGQKLEENPVSQEVLATWKELEGKTFLLDNDLYSSAAYDTGVIRVYLSDVIEGYLYCVTSMGSRILKIQDETLALAPLSIPSSINRDLIDLKVKRGKDGSALILSNGTEYVLADDAKELAGDAVIELTDCQAAWFRIGKDIENKPLKIAERPENSAVYVYDKYGEVIYNSHIKGIGNDLPTPSGGYIAFLGESGDSITVSR